MAHHSIPRSGALLSAWRQRGWWKARLMEPAHGHDDGDTREDLGCMRDISRDVAGVAANSMGWLRSRVVGGISYFEIDV
jgi:hypothetical protein